MNNRPYHETRYQQLQLDIAKYERQVSKFNWWKTLLFGVLAVVMYALVSITLEVVLDKISFRDVLRNYKWHTLLTKLIFWPLLFYFWTAKQPQWKLKECKKELAKLQANHPEVNR